MAEYWNCLSGLFGEGIFGETFESDARQRAEFSDELHRLERTYGGDESENVSPVACSVPLVIGQE